MVANSSEIDKIIKFPMSILPRDRVQDDRSEKVQENRNYFKINSQCVIRRMHILSVVDTLAGQSRNFGKHAINSTIRNDAKILK